MRVRLAFQDAAWETPEARWTASVVASLLEARVRLEPAGAPGGSEAGRAAPAGERAISNVANSSSTLAPIASQSTRRAPDTGYIVVMILSWRTRQILAQGGQ